MTKHELDVARMIRYILCGFKFEMISIIKHNDTFLKVYRIRNSWEPRGNFYVEVI